MSGEGSARDLVEIIEEYKREQGLNDAKFAKTTGTAASTQTRQRNGERKPELEYIGKVGKAFPGLREALVEWFKRFIGMGESK